MFYGILIRMFFFDTDKHNVPHIHAEYQAKLPYFRFMTEPFWPVRFHPRSRSWLSHGSKSTTMISLQTRSWQSTARNLFQFEGLTYEDC
jgi:hypothetical protein